MLSVYQQQRVFFDGQAAKWHFPEDDRQKITNILKSVSLPMDSIILDAGCGAGNLFPILKEQFPQARIIACDMSAGMLAECRRRFPENGIPLWLGFFEDLPLKIASVDLILNYCVLPHIKNREKALAEFWRVLKPGGQYLIIHPQGWKATNRKHIQIGEPIADDLLPPSSWLVSFLSDKFSLRKTVDCDDLFLIEAVKLNRR